MLRLPSKHRAVSWTFATSDQVLPEPLMELDHSTVGDYVQDMQTGTGF